MESNGRLRSWTEVVGVLGVVVSLLFVGYEIRQNTKVARAEAYRAFVGEVTDWYALASDPEFNELFVRLRQEGYDALTPAEQGQLFANTMMIFRVYEGLHKEVTEQILDESALLLLSQSKWDWEWMDRIWPEIRRNLTPDFVAYVEQAHGLGD